MLFRSHIRQYEQQIIRNKECSVSRQTGLAARKCLLFKELPTAESSRLQYCITPQRSPIRQPKQQHGLSFVYPCLHMKQATPLLPTQLSHRLQCEVRGGRNILQVKQYFSLTTCWLIRISLVRGGGRYVEEPLVSLTRGEQRYWLLSRHAHMTRHNLHGDHVPRGAVILLNQDTAQKRQTCYVLHARYISTDINIH